jgi:diadenosine tetraphosphate (Ap4A) HIT family hydrolase
MNDCFFCKSISNKDNLLENDLAIARYDDFPVNKGHLEIIPKRHIKDWWSTTTEEKIAIFNLLDEAKKIVDEKFHPDAYNIGMNLGVAAGQSIMHLHIHLIPRYENDVDNPRGGVRGIIPEKRNY